MGSSSPSLPVLPLFPSTSPRARSQPQSHLFVFFCPPPPRINPSSPSFNQLVWRTSSWSSSNQPKSFFKKQISNPRRADLGMEKLSDRDRARLGYTHQDPFGKLPNSAARRSSDVDFHDVFGGPPRRSSFYEVRRGRGDSLEEGERLRRPWSGPEEKPVFGEMSSPARSRYLGDDFFSDIFPGSESSSSTPRRDFYPSSPGSRVLSSNRPVLARSEPYVGTSSLPAQLRCLTAAHPRGF